MSDLGRCFDELSCRYSRITRENEKLRDEIKRLKNKLNEVQDAIPKCEDALGIVEVELRRLRKQRLEEDNREQTDE